MVQLDYRDSRPIYAQIADGYREQIRSGILSQGDRLPSVRELAAELVINPNTIQRAYRVLEGEGYIATVPGKGCFVCGHPGSCLPERQALLDAFDRTADELMRLGVTRQALIDHLNQKEENHAGT